MPKNAMILFVPTLLFALLGVQMQLADEMPDLFIYRAGAALGWQGESPYSDKIAAAVTAQWPERDDLQRNCGFFLPPQAVLLAGPFAALPWPLAKALYTVLTGIALIACWLGAAHIFRNQHSKSLWDWTAVPWPLAWLITLHLVTTMTYRAGQTTILATAAVLLGQVLHERGRTWLGALFWSFAFVKPHVALPLLPLAFVLSGWTRAAKLLACLVVLNAVASLLIAGTPLFVLHYLQYLQSAHKTVSYNRIDWNPQITSWNRLLYSLELATLELTLTLTLAGYAFVIAIAALRVRFLRSRPSPAWCAAVAAASSGVCCQVMPYELFICVLAVPFILECWRDSRRPYAIALLAILLGQMIPMTQWIYDHHLGAYRAVLALAFLVVVLVSSPRRANDVRT